MCVLGCWDTIIAVLRRKRKPAEEQKKTTTKLSCLIRALASFYCITKHVERKKKPTESQRSSQRAAPQHIATPIWRLRVQKKKPPKITQQTECASIIRVSKVKTKKKLPSKDIYISKAELKDVATDTQIWWHNNDVEAAKRRTNTNTHTHI